MVCQCGTHSNVRAKYGEVAILIESFKYYLIDDQQTKEGSQFAPSRGVEGMSKLNNGFADAHWIQIPNPMMSYCCHSQQNRKSYHIDKRNETEEVLRKP